jgi:hypothetical protein
MPFGFCNAPATFQALIKEILSDIKFTAGLLDDICVWSNTLEQLNERLQMVLQRFAKYGIIINVRKSIMFVTKEIFLEFIVSKDGISGDEDKMAAILEKPQPSITTEIRAFVNAAGYFRHLIENYAKISGPLTDLTGGPKNQPVTLSEKAKTAWQKIRDIITIMPVIKAFD